MLIAPQLISKHWKMKKLIYILILLLGHSAFAALSNVTFVAFDVETTGFSPADERVIEIGAVKYRAGKILDSTHWLINPGRPILNSEVHGITDEQIIGYPGFADTYNAFITFSGDAVLIAHNASFDVRFMAAEIERNGLPPLPNPTINSLTLFRRWFPDAETHKLGRLAEQLHIPVAVEHRAEDDSKTLLLILDQGLKTRPDLTLAEMAETANGTYYFDGTRKP
jgi:DNA polymerase III epsilon subunit family exonuclease